MPFYKNLGHKKGDFPESEKYFSNCLSLPMYPTLSNSEQDYIIDNINYYSNGYK
jgi:dTDP-4-amino-4,6-dideoxygalactose transaminase